MARDDRRRETRQAAKDGSAWEVGKCLGIDSEQTNVNVQTERMLGAGKAQGRQTRRLSCDAHRWEVGSRSCP